MHLLSVILFVVGCVLVLIFNIGIPNELRGCLFFVQVSVHPFSCCQPLILLTKTLKVVGFVYQNRAVDWVSLTNCLTSTNYSSSGRTFTCLVYLGQVSTYLCALSQEPMLSTQQAMVLCCPLWPSSPSYSTSSGMHACHVTPSHDHMIMSCDHMTLSHHCMTVV